MRKLLAITVAFASQSIFAATTWNMATPYPDAEFHTQNIKQFIEDVNKATNGEINITLHSGASLYKAPEIFKAVRSNQIQLGELLISSLGNDDPLFQIDTLPFLATDYDSAKRLWNASKEYISESLAKKGAVLLYTTPWPGQNFYTKFELNNADDLKGKKMRAYNAMTSAISSQLNASPTTVEVSDIAQAFSTGQIDAMITSSATGVSSQAWDFVNNYTQVNAWLPKNMIFINAKEWRRLDDKTKTAILTAAEAAEARGWEMSAAKNSASEQTLTDNGIHVKQASEELTNALKAVGKNMADEWLKVAGPEGKTILENYHKGE